MSAVLEERMRALDARVEDVENRVKELQKAQVELLVELKVLGTRVSLYSAMIAFAVSAAMSIALKFLG